MVVLETSRGRVVENVEGSVLATDGALVDMARRQAGISGSEFQSGEVVS